MKLVLIEWLDSQRMSSDWGPIKNIERATKLGLTCQSVGWVLQDDRDAVSLLPNRAIAGSANGAWASGVDAMAIPKRAILRKTELGPKRRSRRCS